MLSEDKAAFLAAVTRAGDLQNADQAENAAAEPAGESLVTHERITLNFTGTYAAYQAFLSGFELGERKTYFRDITMARETRKGC
jgi:uncharacterized protein (DUF2336 family)